MKILLTKPLPQASLRKVIPAGVVIDAPPGLCRRILLRGIGKPVQEEETADRPVATPGKSKSAGRKVKRDG